MPRHKADVLDTEDRAARAIGALELRGEGQLRDGSPVDSWQRRGLGTALLRALAARAREEGITRFTGLVQAENRSIQALLQTLGPVEQRPSEGGTIEVSLEVPPESGTGEHLRKLASWMRAA